MIKQSKVKTGVKPENKVIKHASEFSSSQRKKIIEEYLSSGKSKQAIWEKHTGSSSEHGRILRWMRSLGYSEEVAKSRNDYQKIRRFAETTGVMPKSKEELEFEIQVLQNRVKELEKQVEESELKAVAFSTMVDIAEKTFNIPVRKKFITKPSKK
ncbi:MAG: hypothetical protein LBC03_00200 [Nitrososphaerota archaeon]|jgi:hypothetical protein|nr:hypothetical protein [Nitrososphaerota archaeon]